MRWGLIGLVLVATPGAALLLAPRPAPACEVECLVYEEWRLRLESVEIVDDAGDTDAAPPDWPDGGRLHYDFLRMDLSDTNLELEPS